MPLMARSLLSRPRNMKTLQLTAVVRDIRTATMVAQPFFRSPVTIGRRDTNALRLDAASVSRHHGAFLFSKHGLQYVDLFSANGSYIDGLRIEHDKPRDLRDSSVLTIGPFQIIVHLDLVSLHVPPSDPEATTRILQELAGPHFSPYFSSGESAANRDVLRSLLPQHSPAETLNHATEIVRVVADLIIRFRGSIDSSHSPLTSSTTRDELVAYLLDPDGGPERVQELRTLLTEMLRFPLTLVSGETS